MNARCIPDIKTPRALDRGSALVASADGDILPPPVPYDGIEPLAVSVNEASRLLGIGRTHLYQQLTDGNLVARKIGSRTVITMASIKALLRA